MDDAFKQSALAYHRTPTPGKISVTPTKPLGNQQDLALAYSPGVAAACEAIPKPFDPRLITRLAPAVAQAAVDAGVARRPIADMAAYRAQLAARRLQAFPRHTH